MTDVHPKRRVCRERGCTTVLSKYNFGDRCYMHAQPEPYSHRVTSQLVTYPFAGRNSSTRR